MKLTIVKKVEFPKDVSEDYMPMWEAFLQMRAVSQLRVFHQADVSVPECFRILINQAGAKVPLQHTVNEFVKVTPIVRRLKQYIAKGGVLDHMRVVKHSQSIQFTKAEPVCAVLNPTFVGIVVLRPQRFDLKYLIGRMQGLVYKDLPFQLSDKLPNGNPRKMRKLAGLRDGDYWIAAALPDTTISMTRTDKELVVRYEINIKGMLPMYAKLDTTLKALWRQSIMGVFA